MRYVVVIPVLNELRYTTQCIESLLAHGTPAEAILVIDNGSSDGTPAWLASHPEIRSVRNPVNLGCGGAWTQGALLADSDWVVLLNNDIVCGHDFVGAQIDAADRLGLQVVSPAPTVPTARPARRQRARNSASSRPNSRRSVSGKPIRSKTCRRTEKQTP